MWLTLGLVVLQLAGCATGCVQGKGAVTDFFLCLDPTQDWWFQEALLLLWAVLAVSWLVGVVGVGVPQVRPVYWLLLLLIPLFMAAQHWFVAHGYHTCHFHI